MKKPNHLLSLCTVMLISSFCLAQNPPPQGTVKLFFEKVFVHTDRELYAPGDDIWLKAYVTNARDNHLIATSKNLYVELIAPADTMVSKEIIHLTNGTGKGDFALPAILPAGNYRLRAYTNWMRNFGDNFIFEKNINITGNTIGVKNTLSTSRSTSARPGAASINNNSVSASIRFFPEGGSLVNELSSIVAVKAENGNGNGIPANGSVISAAGDTVARFTCDSLGMGLFTLLPLSGQIYRGVAKYNGQALIAQLPAALNSGLAIKATKRDTLLYITISCNNAAAAAIAGKVLTLSVKHAGTSYIDKQIQLSDNQALIKIPESILPEGIAAITLYDDQHKANCERLVYIDHNTHLAKLLVTTAKTAYKPRERITLNLKALDADKQPVAGNFSVSIVDGGLNVSKSAGIDSYILLQSEIKGNIERTERYFDTTNVNRSKQLDLLLLTQGWRDFVWKRLAENPINISYLPEQGFTLTGNVKKEAGNKPVAGTNITLSAPKAKGQKLFFTKTDDKGNYYFDNLQLFGDQNVRVSTRDIKGEADGIITLDPTSKHTLAVNNTEIRTATMVNEDIADQVAKRVAINKGLDSVTNLKEVKIKGNRTVVLRDQTALYNGYPDEVLTVKESDLSFKTVKQYILFSSKQAKTDPKSDNIVFYADGKTYKPRIIVDNSEVPFTEDDDADILDHYYNSYYNLPMNVVEKVVIKRLLGGLKPPTTDGSVANAMGNTIAGARATPANNIFIIYLSLKPGALQRKGGGITTANIQGYYETRSFYQPVHSGTGFDSPKPDLRNTIHWDANVTTGPSGQATVTYYNADPKTNVKIIVQGVTDKGEPVTAVTGYIVK